jgi:C4-dicarboxylate-specific signal transduction histidine kinase
VAREVARLASIGMSPNGASGSHSALEITVIGDDDVEAAIAPDALKQVLVNLLQNARDAASPSPARVGVSVRAAGGRVAIDIRDDGPGIAPDIRRRVFDPFFTTKDAVHGVGLGLFVAEGLVRTAGGSISVVTGSAIPPESPASYRGAWFRVELSMPNDLDPESTVVAPTVMPAARAAVRRSS